jgi:uncharacterized protein (DUF1697 family)
MNAKMPALKACFEAAGFDDVRTLLSSGNVVFNARSSSLAALERRAEKAMQAHLGRSFDTIMRSATFLQAFIESAPFAEFHIETPMQCVVTFLRNTVDVSATLPIVREGGSILKFTGAEILSACVPGPKGSSLMTFIERTFGKNVTTRTLETVRKCACG